MAFDITHENVVHGLVERQAAKYGNRIFLYFQDKTFSFRQMDTEASRLAKGLQKLGIAKGDKVAVMLSNCPEFLFAAFGLSKLGAIQVPVNTAHKGNLLTYFLSQSDSRMLITSNRLLDRVEPVLETLPNLERIIVIDQDGSGIPGLSKPADDWACVVDNDGILRDRPDMLWSDPYCFMYTSGTTGPSKGSVTPHNYGFQIAKMTCEAFEFTERDRFYNCFPLFHGFSQNIATMAMLYIGGQMVLTDWFSASGYWEDVKRFNCSSSGFAPAVARMLLAAPPKPDDADNPVQTILSAGVPKEIYDTFEKRFGVIIIEAYGMTETSIPVWSSRRARRAGTAGRPHPDFQVKVVDDNGMEVGPNTPGELLMRPLKPYTMQLEYYKMPEKTVETWRDLWFHTGDCLYLDEDRYVHFVDRIKDAVRRRSENISSLEVEETINTHPSVLESAVIAAKSGLAEDEVMACVVLQPGQTLAPLELIKHCETRMAYFMVPRYVRFMEALPKTPTVKTQKNVLREQGITPDTWDREKTGYRLKR